MPVHKAERLMNLMIMLLEADRPITAQEIRETIPGYGQAEADSFKRMFERDKEELREMGIPLEKQATDVFEVEEGYLIPKDRFYLPDIELEPDERAALWLAANLLKLSDPGMARTALLKLGVSPTGFDKTTRLSWVAADFGLSAPGLEEAFQAVADRKQVHFTYKTRDEQKKRTVDPFGLVHRKGAWYLIGHDHLARAQRSFRLDRLTTPIRQSNPTASGPEFEVPEGFRPDAVLDTPPFAQSEVTSVPAIVEFDSKAVWLVERTEPWLELERTETGNARAEVNVSDVTGFVSWVLWYGEDAEIVEPHEFRLAIRRRLQDICG